MPAETRTDEISSDVRSPNQSKEHESDGASPGTQIADEQQMGERPSDVNHTHSSNAPLRERRIRRSSPKTSPHNNHQTQRDKGGGQLIFRHLAERYSVKEDGENN